MTDKTYLLSDGQRIIIHDSLNHCIQHGLFRPGYAAEFAEVFAMFQTEHPAADPGWDDPRFTDEDRTLMVTCVEEEIRDCTKDLAFEQLAGEPLVDLIAYADPDCDGTVHFLGLVADEASPVTGKYLREHDDRTDELIDALNYAKRMGLINPEENEVTSLGLEYIARFK